MSESELMRTIMIEVSKLGAKVFRNNTAQGWVGNLVYTRQDTHGLEVKLRNARPLHAGLCVGSSDIIGFYRGLFTAIEVKSGKGKLTEEQRNFLDAVRQSGGIAVEARSVEDALEALRTL